MQSNNAILTVVTRTQNRPLFLKRALLSIAQQTNKDLIHVIVNDAGDKQQVEDVVAENASKDVNTKVIHIDTKGKMEQASNKGIAEASTELIAIHDDDDTWHPEFVEQVLGFMETNPDSNGVVVRTDKIVEEIQDDGHIKFIKKSHWMPDMNAISLYRQCIDNQMTPITFVYKRSVYEEIGKYDESLPVMGDWDFGIRYLLKYDVDYLDPGFALANYHHRKHKPGAEGNTSYSGNNKKIIVGNYLMNKYLREELTSGKIGPGYIMSKTKYEQNFLLKQATRFLPGNLSKRLTKRYLK